MFKSGVLFCAFLLSIGPIMGCGDDDAGGGDAGGDAGGCARVCDDGLFCNGTEQCDPGAAGADGDGCVGGTSPCGDGETCDDTADTCIGCSTTSDADGDGADAVSCGGDDCDDTNPSVFPGAAEICNTIDEDCDPTTLGGRDEDGDGFVDAACCNGDRCGDDCDDGAAGVHPTESEVCDGVDNDCDGLMDEGVLASLWPDADRDGFGDQDADPIAGCPDLEPDLAPNGDDCDDDNAARNPGEIDRCDDIPDNDCSGSSPFDADDDGFDSNEGPMCAMGLDCNDDDDTFFPGAPDLCDGIDQNCDGPEDADEDGQLGVDELCSGGPFEGPKVDCDDHNRAVFMGADELCDLLDNDCDGRTDESGFDNDPRPLRPFQRDGSPELSFTTCCNVDGPAGGEDISATLTVLSSLDDAPVPNVFVDVHRDGLLPEDGSCPAATCMTVRTDSSGEAPVTVRRGSPYALRIAASASRLGTINQREIAPSLEGGHVQTKTLPRAVIDMFEDIVDDEFLEGRGIVSGSVSDCNNERVQNITIRLYDASTPVCAGYYYENEEFNALRTEEAGVATVVNVPPGQYLIQAIADLDGDPSDFELWAQEEVTVLADTHTRIDLRPRRDPPTGAPAPGPSGPRSCPAFP